MLLKHDIFQKIPPEFYGKVQESFFGEIITQSKKEFTIMKRLEDSEGHSYLRDESTSTGSLLYSVKNRPAPWLMIF